MAANVDAAGSTTSAHAASAAPLSGGVLCVPAVPSPLCSASSGVGATLTPVATAVAGTEGSGSRIGKGGKDTATEVSPDGVEAVRCVHGEHGDGGLASPSPTTPACPCPCPCPCPCLLGGHYVQWSLPGTCYTLSGAVVRHHCANAGAGHYTTDV